MKYHGTTGYVACPKYVARPNGFAVWRSSIILDAPPGSSCTATPLRLPTQIDPLAIVILRAATLPEPRHAFGITVTPPKMTQRSLMFAPRRIRMGRAPMVSAGYTAERDPHTTSSSMCKRSYIPSPTMTPEPGQKMRSPTVAPSAR